MYLYRSGNSDIYIELPEFNCDHFTLSGWIRYCSSAVGKAFMFFCVPKTLCRCWSQQRSRRSVEDCLQKRSCNKERQIFGSSLSLFVLYAHMHLFLLRLSVMFG